MKRLKQLLIVFRSMPRRLLALILVCILLLCAIPVFAAKTSQQKNISTYDRILNRDGFLYGVNFPWYKGETWFGSYIDGKGQTVLPTYDETVLNDMLQNCKAIGFNSVQFWLFYHYSGIKVDEVGNILGFDKYFETNLRNTLNAVRKTGLTVTLAVFVHTGEDNLKQGIDWQERAMQPLANPTIRKQYFEKILKPLCSMLDEYRDVIAVIDAYEEPESTVDEKNNFGFGVYFEDALSFVKESCEVIHNNLPGIPVSCASGWGTNLSRYNDLGLDIIGTDIYTDDASVYDPEEQHADAPVVCFEFGPSNSSKNISDEFQIAHTTKFFRNAISAGYRGAYIWMYNGWTGDGHSLITSDIGINNLRPVAAAIRFMIMDNIAEHQQKESDDLDKPSMLGTSNPYQVKWIGSRGAENYKLETSKDNKKWTVIDDKINPDAVDDNNDNICVYRLSEIEQGTDCYYRVTASDSDKRTAVSESRKFSIPVITCSDNDNLVKNHNFATGDFTDWSVDTTVFSIENGVGFDGNNYVHLVGNGTWSYLSQSLQVEPNTEYIFTVYQHAPVSSDRVNMKSIFKAVSFKEGTNLTGDQHYSISDTDWIAYTTTINSGDLSQIDLYFGNGGSEAYIDSVYFFKKP